MENTSLDMKTNEMICMLPIIIEQVDPKNDDFLRLRREEVWIRTYQSVEFGANSHS